ncbi:hypothetical protein RJT34_13852 [Clitoria ternatea]|uniref:Uncharacterized protein n=1 Tax=Clitoria ternatea TaxID=43366 RepID=A0AAN9JPB2_CLITE
MLIILVINVNHKESRALPRREPFQKFSKAQGKPRPKRGFGNSFQPAIDAPRILESVNTDLSLVYYFKSILLTICFGGHALPVLKFLNME